MQIPDVTAIVILGVFLFLGYFGLKRGRREASTSAKRQIAVDGTNVMFWRDETAQLSTLQVVLKRLGHEGFDPVVFLDASSRHHLGDKSLNERKFAQVLGLNENRIMVVPKGTEADAFILEYAGQQKLAVVSNDRFRDRPSEARNIRLVKGRFEGSRLVLKNL